MHMNIYKHTNMQMKMHVSMHTSHIHDCMRRTAIRILVHASMHVCTCTLSRKVKSTHVHTRGIISSHAQYYLSAHSPNTSTRLHKHTRTFHTQTACRLHTCTRACISKEEELLHEETVRKKQTGKQAFLDVNDNHPP